MRNFCYTIKSITSHTLQCFFFLLLSLTCSTMSIAAWSPIIRHFTPQDYGAGTQNWDIIEHANGWIYVANNYGLLETDGSQWQLYGIHNATAIRSLALGDDGAIYAGGTDEFGVFRADSLGGLAYQKLSHTIPERYRHFGEVWKILIHNQYLYIQTRHYIFIYDPSGNCEVLDPGAIIYESLIWEGNLYIATARDIYVQSGGRLHALRGTDALHNTVVCSMLPYAEEGIIIATDFHGLYIYDGKNIQAFYTDADAYIAENQLYTIAISEQQIAMGTVQGGLVLTDEKGKNCKYINKDMGLQNNTILSILFDTKNNLWLGLDNGIDVGTASNPILFYRDKRIDYGSGYASLEYQGNVYFGTNQGLYYWSDSQPSLTLVEGSQGQVWSLAQLGNTLFCCHNRGLFYLQNNQLISLESSDGAWKICPLSSSSAIVGTYTGFYHLYLSPQGRWQLRYLEGFTETALYFTLDATGKIWILSSQGVERLTVDLTTNTLTSERMIEQPAAHRVLSITNYKKHVLITSDDHAFVVDTHGELSSNTAILDDLSGKHRYLNIEEDAHNNLWYIYDNRVAHRSYDSIAQTYHPEQIIWYPASLLIGGFTNLKTSSRGGVLIGGVSGFYFLQVPKNQIQHNSKVYVRKIVSLNSPNTILYGESYDNTPQSIVIPANERALRISLGGNSTDVTLFRTRLYPLEETFTPWQQAYYRDFITLPAGGDFRLDIEMLSTRDGQLTTRSVPIKLLYPFYLSFWAKALYIMCVIALTCFIIWRINIRVQRSKRLLAETKNQEIYQQQMRILQLENEKAQFDLRNKSQELSNMLLSEANRKEWNAEVLNDIHRIVDMLNTEHIAEAKAKIQQLQNRLARNGETAINWKRFEENFDIVNNQFITRLSELYPWMSKQERRLCVYIHIGLSSKEIAPLLNVSTRAVEMMRYRVRNKMNIDSSISLKQYFRELQTRE